MRPVRLLLAAALLCAACASRAPNEVRVTPDGVQFRLRQPGATVVSVAGDFNDWSDTASPMMRSGDVWIATLRLPAGEYQFMYVVDGTWIAPPDAAEVVPDGFGGSNGKIVVP